MKAKHMIKLNLKWWQASLIILLSLLLALGLAQFILNDFSSLEVFAPMEKKLDFQVSDIYNAVEEKKHVVELSREVVVVSVDDCNREQTAEVINLIASYAPKAIGLDISFMTRKANNDTLLHAILDTKNLVVATKVAKPDESIYYEREQISFFESEYDLPHVGYANLDAARMWDIVRTFVPYVLLGERDTLPGMAMELARVAYPERVPRLIQRRKEVEIIDYTDYEIEVIDAARLENAYVASRLRDKVVLVGDVADPKDTYRTPLHDALPGVLVHAYALQTILSGRYIDTTSTWCSWIIAMLIAFVLVVGLLFATEYKVLNLFIRIGQFMLMYMLVVVGCEVYSHQHMYVDFAPTILMLGFGALAFDIVYALNHIVEKVVNRLKNR